MKRLFVSLAIILVLVLTISGCSSTATSTTTPAFTTLATTSAIPTTTVAPTPTATGPVPVTGGILKIMATGNPTSFYPPTMTGSGDGQNIQPCVESLLLQDDKGNLMPLLATGYKVDATAKTITLTLRKGVKFHDGSDFNATVVKWNLDQFRTGARTELKLGTSVDIVDDYTVRLNLSKFDNTILAQLSLDPGRMVSQVAFTANGGAAWAAKNPVGTGAFKFQSFTPDVSYSFVRFDDYWGGKPYLDGVTRLIYTDYTVANMALQTGSLDIAALNPSDTVPLQKSGKFIIGLQPGQMSMLAGDVRDSKSPFNDLLVRQAMTYAIDTKSIADGLGLGYYAAMNQFAVPGTVYYNPNIVGYPYNPQKAKDLLTQAGFPGGFDITLNFFNNTAVQLSECTAMKSMLDAVGIRTTLNPLQRPAFADMASNGKGWSGILRTQDAAQSFDPLVVSSKFVNGQEFAGMFIPPDYLNAFNAAVSATDDAAKIQLTWQASSIGYDKYCVASPLYVQGIPEGKSLKVHDDLWDIYPNHYLSPKTWLSK